MSEPYTDRYSSERIEETIAILEITFFDENLEVISKEEIEYEYVPDTDCIKVVSHEPSQKVKDNLKSNYWMDDIKDAIEAETGIKISEISFIKS